MNATTVVLVLSRPSGVLGPLSLSGPRPPVDLFALSTGRSSYTAPRPHFRSISFHSVPFRFIRSVAPIDRRVTRVLPSFSTFSSPSLVHADARGPAIPGPPCERTIINRRLVYVAPRGFRLLYAPTYAPKVPNFQLVSNLSTTFVFFLLPSFLVLDRSFERKIVSNTFRKRFARTYKLVGCPVHTTIVDSSCDRQRLARLPVGNVLPADRASSPRFINMLVRRCSEPGRVTPSYNY